MDNRSIDAIINDFKCHDKGLILPLVNEYTWSVGARAFLYFLGLVWSFLGVSIISDKFMGAIEMITSKERQIRIKSAHGETKFISVPVWNNTVANLTLMALGSSAPEILLSCIEIIGNKFEAGQLGPGTIVGSAAFNLLVIIAVCVVSIPNGEGRRIKSMGVFAITGFCSIFAYIWLIIILVQISPNRIEIWEAAVTFLSFPVMVIICYITDKNCFGCGRSKKLKVNADGSPIGDDILLEDYDKEKGIDDKDREVIKFLKQMRSENPDVNEEDLEMMAREHLEKNHMNKPHNYLFYRIQGVRAMTAGKSILPQTTTRLRNVIDKHVNLKQINRVKSAKGDQIKDIGNKTMVQFDVTSSCVKEGDGYAHITLKRTGNLDIPMIAQVETVDGTAKVEDNDYIRLHKIFVFLPGIAERQIDIAIIDDNEFEDDEVFYVKLQKFDEFKLFNAIKLPDEEVDTTELMTFIEKKFKKEYKGMLQSFAVFQHNLPQYLNLQSMLIGSQRIHEITIEDDDTPGTLSFNKPYQIVRENLTAKIEVTRKEGSDGAISVEWKTKDGKAKGGKDFRPTEGILEFKHRETSKFIEIDIINDDDEDDEDFDLYLDQTTVSKGVQFGIATNVITIVSDDDYRSLATRIRNNVKKDILSIQLEKESWKDQFVNAFSVVDSDISEATLSDFILHFLSFFWKVLFAFVPPPSLWGGWLSFFVSLGAIGMLTAIIGDLASIGGCLIGLEDAVTAITFVAMGTSLPDLFASKQAAVNEETADNSIGNVTGSNSVNVFLGLGLPWLIASIYHYYNDSTFKVDASTLSFSVVIYSSVAFICLMILLMRRFIKPMGTYELGGPRIQKYIIAAFMVFLWFTYVILSSLQTYKKIPGF